MKVPPSEWAIYVVGRIGCEIGRHNVTCRGRGAWRDHGGR